MQHAREKEAKFVTITHQCEGKWRGQGENCSVHCQWTEFGGANETRLFQNRVKRGELVIKRRCQLMNLNSASNM
jgi:hypothetical protein